MLCLVTGCATVRTASHFTRESPKLYSGVRLDLHAIRHENEMLRAYDRRDHVAPPARPALDLPFSFLLDSALLPVTSPVALYEVVFE